MRILLIDDESIVAENLRYYLEGEGHTVKAVTWLADEGAATRLLKRFRPQAVSLDYELELDASQRPSGGAAIYRWIRAWSRDVPVVFYTKYARSPEIRRLMLEAGAKEAEIIGKQEVSADYLQLLRSFEKR